jgi:hypothetical protein
MKYIIFILFFLYAFVYNTTAQKRISYSLFTYSPPKNIEPDETDPEQKVYYQNFDKDDFLIIVVWDVVKAKKSVIDDYLYFLKQVKIQHSGIADYTREPTIITKQNPTAKWQTAYCKGIDTNGDTKKVTTLNVTLHVITMGNKTAAIHFATNNVEKSAAVIKLFMDNLKLKKL